MSLSSYIKRQSRVARRSRAMSIVGLGLASILEDPEPAIDLTSNSSVEQDEEYSPVKSTKKNSMKAKRRLGVSDLAIPRTSALFTAVQGVDDDAHAEWRLRLSLSDDSGNSKDDTESFDFPRPPMLDLPSEESESSSSSGGSSSSSSSSGSSSNSSDTRQAPPSRPPPRTPMPTDAVRLSDDFDYAADYVAYTPLLVSRTPSPEGASSAAILAALLSPPPHTPAAHSPSSSTPHTPATPAPHHPARRAWDSEDDDFVYGAAYDEDAIFDEYAEDREEYNDVPLSPFIASAPSRSPSTELDLDLAVVDDVEMEPEEEVAVSDVPTPAPYTGWHPRPRASQLRLAVLPILTGASGARTPSPSRTRYSHAHGDSGSSWVTSHSPTPSLSSPSAPSSPPPEPATPEPQTPTLRSRWSSSTLSSVPSIRSPHAAASPRTFGFARRLSTSPSPSTSASSSRVGAKENGKPRPMGAASVFPSTPSPKPSPAKPKGKGIGSEKGLTAANVRRVLPPSLLLPPSLSMSNAMRDHAAYTPYMAKAGDDAWIGTRPSAPSVLACTSPDVFASYSGSASSPYTPSPGFSGHRGSKRWSYVSVPGDGGEEADDDAGSMGRRKPIPVEMFLRS
ncbi:hypothetical protein C8F04DRAFT_1101580 [Mycena alexandri]|uniref:Uncharacterized protein n=1 Tax=Mycena alexandri TaxID=1745969 RepID=A0AAD6SWZ7_9AGAR|nr:hypothetical protein C8F04DRAFT_1101580 [Mycena alexandri]